MPPAPYTDEDWALMKDATIRWMYRHRGPYPLAQIYVPADRRDADLMLYAVQFYMVDTIGSCGQPDILVRLPIGGRTGAIGRPRPFWESNV